jgi:hypothetical protein
MEDPLTTWQFLQLAAVLGAPVHAALAIAATLLLRFKRSTPWSKLLLLVPIWLALSVALQVATWAALPDLPEPMFMVLGVINGPASVGASMILVALWVLVPHRPRQTLARSA